MKYLILSLVANLLVFGVLSAIGLNINILAAMMIVLVIPIMISESSPDSCVKCYTMFLPFLLIKIDVFS